MNNRKAISVLFVIVLLVGMAACAPKQGLNQTGNASAGKNVSAKPVGPTSAVIVNPAENANGSASETPALSPEPAVATPKAPEGRVPTKTVREGDIVSFPNLKVTDPEGDPLKYTFSDPLNESGMWQTKTGDAGTYKVQITASDGKNTATQDVVVIVEVKNTPPSIELGDVSVKEGDTVKLAPKLTDAEGDPVAVTYSGWMTADTKQTSYDDAGKHEVTLVAGDGKSQTTKVIIVEVANTNRAPKLDPLSEVVTVKEGEKANFLPTAKDPDGDKVNYQFSAPLDEKGAWQTKAGDAGKYRVNITATDGELSDTIKIFLVVEAVNNAPVIKMDSNTLTVKEGEKVTLMFSVDDADGDKVTTTIGGWMNGIEYQTNNQDQGTHKVTITADDGKQKTTKEVTVIVEDVNRAPVFDPNSFG